MASWSSLPALFWGPVASPGPRGGLVPTKVARVAIIATLACATFAYGALEKRVTVRIDGRPVSVTTYAGTVAGALTRAGVRLGADDRVVPAATSALYQGSVI